MSLRAKRSNPDNILKADLDHILTHTRDLWEELRDQRIFITGGTGFFGCWLLESFAWANDKLHLNAEALVLTRNYDAFLKKAPFLATNPAIKFHIGDVKDFVFPEGQFSHLIHSAVYQQPSDEKLSNLYLVNEMLTGTRHVLDFCVLAKIKKMLLISSGAVYGKLPAHLEKIPEDFSDAIDPTVSASAYHHVRRMMETLSVLYAQENDFEAKIARCFSFIGPYLPLNGRFAVSDFILDVLSGNRITVKGDGKAVRSYLYMADLATWLWMILFRGITCKPYNVGSELPITIRAMAEEIANESVPPLGVAVLGESCHGVAQDNYVPDTSRAQLEIGVRQYISLVESIKKTMRWYRNYY
ncbi:MAG: NAD(P)-dependent oxidoreductase [Spirochaetales bacterium]|jgi:nucleoside-diphosphate-sugar epimerase|nr:NAD(P)-dependent oxidoreductase [Spirochaetales bacterium]